MRALIIVDVQNDFCDGGAVPVAGAEAVAQRIGSYADSATGWVRYNHVVATQDWHIDPGAHFAEHPDYQNSWPPHCVAGSPGADLSPALDCRRIEAIFQKGSHSAGYSGFSGIDAHGTALVDWLHQHRVSDVDVVGVATEHCVRATAEDAVRAGFGTTVLVPLTAGVSAATAATALADLRRAGVVVMEAV